MTKTKQAEVMDAGDFDVDSMLDTFRTHSRAFTIGAIVVIGGGLGALLWRQSAIQKDEKAENALNLATSELNAGNRPLAMADLAKVVERYRDTASGVEAAMILAQVDFEVAKWDDGVKVLESVKKSGAIANFGGPIDGLIGGALADQKKYAESAKSYLAAAAESGYQSAKDGYQADAARILMIAGKKDEARKIWESIASRPDSPMVAEARVRLGELEAVPAKN